MKVIDEILLVCLVIQLSVADVTRPFNQKLLVVSFDGFRQLYFDDGRFLPWFTSFRDEGVYSDRVQSIFPSETFPNHYAIVTGMYAESHGIIANSMYDPNLNKTFSKADMSPHWWQQAEPVWITAVRQGKRSAVSFWPGSGCKFPPGNYTPTYYIPVYDDKILLEWRINETVYHLANDNVDLAFIYYYQPDADGHAYGAPSNNVNEKLKINDWYLSYLLTRLDKAGLGKDKLNVILCSDHGMTNVTKMLYLEDYISMADDVERVPAYGPVVNLQPKQGKLDKVMKSLEFAIAGGEPFKAYRKSEVPRELHYSANDRIMDIVIVCDLGVYMKPTRPPVAAGGVHGYDPKLPAMKPMFMARGPAFKTGGYRAANVFETKDIYAIITHVVGIQPRETNATLDLVMDLFTTSSAVSNLPSVFHPTYYCYFFVLLASTMSSVFC